MQVLPTIRTELVHEFVNTFKITVPDAFFFDLATQEITSGRFVEAAICISNSKMFDRFNCHELCLNLVDVNKVGECKLILNEAEHLRRPVVESLCTPKFVKTATKLVLDYSLDPETFPNLMNLVARNCSIFFISRVFKKEDHADYAPLHKVEDLLVGQPKMLSNFVAELCKHADKQISEPLKKLWLNRARGVWTRHGLEHSNDGNAFVKANMREALGEAEYDHGLEPQESDLFGPVTKGAVALSSDVHVTFISDQSEVEQLLELVGQPVIGLDAEWRPNLTKFIKTYPAILQVSSETRVFLIDLVALNGCTKLNEVLTQVFMDERSLKVGLALRGDLTRVLGSTPEKAAYA